MADPTPTPTRTPTPTPVPPVTPPAAPPPPDPAPAQPGQAPTPPASPSPGVPAPPVTPPAQPVPLSLKMAEKALVDQASLDRTLKVLTDGKVSQEQAQTIADHIDAEVAAHWQRKEAEAVQLRTVEWVNQTKADPEIGGAKFDATMADAARARAQFFNPEFDKMLDTTGLGNHPEFVRAWAKVGQALAQSAIRQPNNTPPAQPLSEQERLDRMFPSSAGK